MLKFGAKIGENERIPPIDPNFVQQMAPDQRPALKKEEYSKFRLAQ